MAKDKENKKKKKGEKKEAAGSQYAGIPEGYVSRLYQQYRNDVMPAMREKFNYKNTMQIPRLKKIVVNMGMGEATENIKVLEDAAEEMRLITGQQPRMNRATRSVAAFKVREGMPVGCSVTLRGWRMYDFLDRLINVAIPRVRDFRGLSRNSFDGRGNYNLGIKEHIIFTELDYGSIENIHGMNVTAVTSAETDEECRELLSLMGMPFQKK
ncbi:MAG: 50S ribosomal protein L5 [Candidatus Sumerlaeota bacterium]